MARIELVPEIQDDFDRILDHLLVHTIEDAPGRIREIIQAIDVLQHNPLIGRLASADTRELVIGRRAAATWRCTAILNRSTRSSCSQFAVSERRATAELNSVEGAHRLIVADRRTPIPAVQRRGEFRSKLTLLANRNDDCSTHVGVPVMYVITEWAVPRLPYCAFS